MASVKTGAEAALTRSFRFGDSLAAAATSILRLLGEERTVVGDPNRDTRIAAIGRTETILCRTNAGVVSVVVEALADGRRPHVVGGVAGLISMLDDVSKLKRSIPAECPEFFGFKDWTEVVEFSESEEGESLRSFVKIVLAHGELNLIQKLRSVSRDETSADLVVSTGHKAKGREWDSVTLFSDFEPRLSKDVPAKPVLNEEEARLLYVAATRARKLLVVPPRLAEKWNVSPAPIPSIGRLPAPAVATAKPTRALPQLPSFATVVTNSPAAAPPTEGRLTPDTAPTPRLETPKVQPAMATRTSLLAKAPAPKPSLLSSLLSLFNGKK